MTRLLSKKDVMDVLDMNDTINILQKAFIDLATGKADMPQRSLISSPSHNGLALFMPAYLQGMGALGAKVVTVYKENPAKYKIPSVLGTIILLDEKTGAPIALMEGGYLTAMRTGGVAGLATKVLARRDSKVHVLFGTGGMARTHAWAVDCVRNIEKLILYSVDPVEKQESFRETLKDVIGCEIEIAQDPAHAVKNADIITLITSAHDPIIDGDWLKPGTHINGGGSHAPNTREIDSKTVIKSKVVCDLEDACRAEAGDFIIPAENEEWNWGHVHGSLGDVLAGKILPRENETEITLFKSVGLAIQDVSVALHVYNQAVLMGAGTDFSF